MADIIQITFIFIQNFKRRILARDSDCTKLTPAERAWLEESDRDLERGETTKYGGIDWNKKTPAVGAADVFAKVLG